MQVLLNQDVKKLGYRGDIVSVKPGYFQNFLMPNSLAVIADKSVLALVEERNKTRVLKKQQILENAKDLGKKLKGLSVVIKEKVSEKGTLYGSVTEQEVIEAIKSATNLELAKEMIFMDHIKELGKHSVQVKIGEDVSETVSVNVEALEA